MITFEDAIRIANQEKKKTEAPGRKAIFTHARDCKKFWTFSFEFENSAGERFGTYGPRMHFDISKEDGKLLNFERFDPIYWIMYNKGKNIPVPEEY